MYKKNVFQYKLTNLYTCILLQATGGRGIGSKFQFVTLPKRFKLCFSLLDKPIYIAKPRFNATIGGEKMLQYIGDCSLLAVWIVHLKICILYTFMSLDKTCSH